MARAVQAGGLLLVALLAVAASSRAEESAVSMFDSPGAAALELPQIHLDPSAAGRPAAAPRARRPDADLYYFSPEEAKAAAERFGDQSKKPRAKGFVFDSDVPADIQAQMRADLAFIGGIAGGQATPLHDEIFGKVDGANYTKFFEDRVTAIGMNDCGSAKAVACVIPMQDPSKMWLTQNFIKFSHPQVARMMVVFHEARHTETQNGNWPHATCPDPFKDDAGNDMTSIWTGASLAGEPACDETPKGSYGSSTIMLKNIQKFCTNCTDKVKMDAGLYADDQLKRVLGDARQQMKGDLGIP